MTRFRPKGGKKRARRGQLEPESWELRHGAFTPMGYVEQMGKRVRAVRYSKIRKEAWVPMLVLIALALALMVAFVAVGLVVEWVT